MKTLSYLTLLSLLISFTFVSCSKDDENSEAEGGNDNPTGNTLTCKVDGVAWTASLAVVAVNSSGVVSITGSDSNAQQCNFSLMNVTGAGTYEVGTTMTNPNLARWTAGLDPNDTYTTSVGQGAGSVTITEFTSTGFKGSFEFTAKNTAQTEVSITEGDFNASFETK